MLTFLSPWWAIAMAGAIGLPLLAHLLSRKGGRPVVFPAVRFVQRASADVSRRLRPRHWLLLLLRTTMLAMVVLAFMQPVWRSTVTSTEAAQQEEAGVMAAILIDRSASMQRVERGASLYDEARRQARQMLGGLDPTRDRAAIVLVDRQPRSLMPEPSANFTQLTRLLDSTPVSHERGRLDDALRLAASLGDRSRPVHIEVFTDAQATSSSTDLLDDVERLGGRVRIHQVGREAGNVALSRPALLPARPVAGQPATLSVDVANHSSEHRSITVEVSGAARTQRQTVTIEPFTTSRASFHLAFDRIGKTVVDAAIVSSERERGVPNDALAVDNQTGLLVEVAAARPVTLVTRSAVTDPASAAWFVARALVPAADEGGGDTGTGDGGSGIALSVASPADLPRLVTEPSQADLPAVLVVAEAGSVDGEGRGAGA